MEERKTGCKEIKDRRLNRRKQGCEEVQESRKERKRGNGSWRGQEINEENVSFNRQTATA